MTKGRYTLEEHRKLGRTLHRVSSDLAEAAAAYSRAFPKSGNSRKTMDRFNKAIRMISEIRCFAEEDLAEDFPGEWSPKIYYPGGSYDES